MMITLQIYYVQKSSLGVRRFCSTLMEELNNLGLDYCVSKRRFFIVQKTNELLFFPLQVGSLLSTNQVIFVHDLISYRYLKNRIKKFFYFGFYYAVFNRASFLIVYSEWEKQFISNTFSIPKDKIKKYFPIYNIVLPINPRGFFGDSFFLMITNSCSHKNSESVIEVFEKCEHKNLIVVGLKRHNSKNIKYYINIEDLLLKDFMDKCITLISPSLDEGFNLPVYDCISRNKIPIVSAIPLHLELYTELAIFVESFELELPPLLNQDSVTYRSKDLRSKLEARTQPWSVLASYLTDIQNI